MLEGNCTGFGRRDTEASYLMDRHQERPVVSRLFPSNTQDVSLALGIRKVACDSTPFLGAFLHVIRVQPNYMINESSMPFSGLCVNISWLIHIPYTVVMDLQEFL